MRCNILKHGMDLNNTKPLLTNKESGIPSYKLKQNVLASCCLRHTKEKGNRCQKKLQMLSFFYFPDILQSFSFELNEKEMDNWTLCGSNHIRNETPACSLLFFVKRKKYMSSLLLLTLQKEGTEKLKPCTK